MCVHVCMCLNVCVHMRDVYLYGYTCMQMCSFIRVHICMHVCAHVHVFMVCSHLCVSVHSAHYHASQG